TFCGPPRIRSQDSHTDKLNISKISAASRACPLPSYASGPEPLAGIGARIRWPRRARKHLPEFPGTARVVFRPTSPHPASATLGNIVTSSAPWSVWVFTRNLFLDRLAHKNEREDHRSSFSKNSLLRLGYMP